MSTAVFERFAVRMRREAPLGVVPYLLDKQTGRTFDRSQPHREGYSSEDFGHVARWLNERALNYPTR